MIDRASGERPPSGGRPGSRNRRKPERGARVGHLLAIGLLLAAASGCSPLSSLLSPPAPDPVEGLERRELPNGLVVLVKEDHRRPTVTTVLAYRVGSVNEPEGMTGSSHFLEHMVFRGTKKYARGEIDRVTLRCGGENNAFTTHDMTGYYFHVTSDHLDEVLDILSETVGQCTLDPRELELERGPVLQEMNLWLDAPWAELERSLHRSLHGEGRYRHPVLGWREDVETLGRESLYRYYQEHYTPNNAVLVIVGDIPIREALGRATRCFGDLPRGKAPEAPRWSDVARRAPRPLELKTEASGDRFMMGFRTCALGTDEDLALDLLAIVLGEGRLSRLRTRLVTQEGLSSDGGIQVSNDSRRYEGTFVVQVEVAPEGSLEKAIEAVGQEMAKLMEMPVAEEELRRAKNLARAKFLFDLESEVDLAWKIGYFEALRRPAYLSTYLGRIEGLGSAQIQAAAKRFLCPRYQAVVRGKGAARAAPGAKPAGFREPGPVRGGRRAGGAILPGDVSRRPDEEREVRLSNGMTLVAQRRSGLPIVSIQASINAGSLYESEENSGLGELVASLLEEGTEDDQGRKHSGEEIVSRLEFVGGQYSASATSVSVKVLSDHWALGFDTVRDVLRFASLPEDSFADVREGQLAQIDQDNLDPARVAQRLFFEAAYPGHPYHRPPLGYKEGVRKIRRSEAVAYYRRFFRPENIVLAVVGDLDPDRALHHLRSRFEDWQGAEPWQAPQIPPAPGPTRPGTLYHTFRSKQLRIHLGHVGIPRGCEDYHALRVMETILGTSPGFTNRLACTVRDELGLAYDVSGGVTAQAGIAPGPFQITLGVEAKDLHRAHQAVLGVVRAFLEQGPTEEEVRDAKLYLLGAFGSAWDSAESQAGYLLSLKRYQLGSDYPEQYREGISSVTTEEVRRVARKVIHPQRFSVVFVGPVEPSGRLIEGRWEEWSTACRECNAKVGTEESTCPHCGAAIGSPVVVRQLRGVGPVLGEIVLGPRAIWILAVVGVLARILVRSGRA
jgi:zinc protease